MVTVVEDHGKGRVKCTVLGDLFKAVVQAFLLFGSNNLVLNPLISQMMGRVQNMVDCHIIGKQLWRLQDISCE